MFLRRMESVVARSEIVSHLQLQRVVGAETPSALVEPVLVDGIGARVVPGRLQYVVVQPGDVGHEAKRLERSVCIAWAPSLVAITRWVTTDGPVIPQRVHRDVAALVVGGKQVTACTVRGQKRGRVFRRHRAVRVKPPEPWSME